MKFVSIAFGTFLVFISGFILGANMGIRNVEKEAIKAGAGKMIVPTEYSTSTRFVFVTNNIPIIP